MPKLKPNQFILSGHLITEIPILFQTEMVQANLADRKTQTRREFNQPSYLTNEAQKFKGMGFINGNKSQYAASIGTENFSTLFKCKYGKPGDLLWVRESFCMWPEKGLTYKTQSTCDPYGWKQTMKEKKIKWTPSIHMPKSNSRIWAMVEEIRVERVQDISEEDAKAEGIKEVESNNSGFSGNVFERPNYKRHYASARLAFSQLWISINGQESWESNPWVWVIKYRILSKIGRPSDEVILRNHLEIIGNK